MPSLILRLPTARTLIDCTLQRVIRWFGLEPSYNATGASGESSEGKISFKTPAFQQIKQMDAFAESILKDTTPLASGEEGMTDLKIIEAIVRSADTGNKVKLIW